MSSTRGGNSNANPCNKPIRPSWGSGAGAMIGVCIYYILYISLSFLNNPLNNHNNLNADSLSHTHTMCLQALGSGSVRPQDKDTHNHQQIEQTLHRKGGGAIRADESISLQACPPGLSGLSGLSGLFYIYIHIFRIISLLLCDNPNHSNNLLISR